WDPVAAFSLSPDGRRLALRRRDGMVQIRDAQGARLLVTFTVLPSASPGKASKDWIAFTPDGYYNGSPGAEQFIRWRVGKNLCPGRLVEGDSRRRALVQEGLREPGVLSAEEEAKVTRAVDLLHQPGWINGGAWPAEAHRAFLARLAELSAIDLDLLRIAVRRI